MSIEHYIYKPLYRLRRSITTQRQGYNGQALMDVMREELAAVEALEDARSMEAIEIVASTIGTRYLPTKDWVSSGVSASKITTFGMVISNMQQFSNEIVNYLQKLGIEDVPYSTSDIRLYAPIGQSNLSLYEYLVQAPFAFGVVMPSDVYQIGPDGSIINKWQHGGATENLEFVFNGTESELVEYAREYVEQPTEEDFSSAHRSVIRMLDEYVVKKGIEKHAEVN